MLIASSLDMPRSETAYLGAVRAAFAADYEQARRNFVAAAQEGALLVDGREHPLRGPHGERLSTDVVWAGPRAARRVLVLVSATHGVEGFAGSAVQTDWLLGGGHERLPDNCAVMLIHAANPWGFSWLRRVTQEGVDLNRNFIDFASGVPVDEGYAALADSFLPESLEGEALLAADARVQAYAMQHGTAALEVALASGQYTHPAGLFYGGTAPTWSRRTLETLADDYDLGGRAVLCVVDLHTGLGPFGYGELICDHAPETRPVEIARSWFGLSVTEPLRGTSTSGPKRGLVDYFWHRLVDDRGCMLTLEFGTFPFNEVFAALRADHWLHAQGAVGWDDPRTQGIKARLRRTFYPDTADWQEMVLFRGRQVIRQALGGLSSFSR